MRPRRCSSTAPAPGQEFFREYQQAYHFPPDSRTAKFYDTAQVVVAALRAAGVANTPASRDEDRQKVRDCLAGLDRPEKAVPGVSGLLWFDEHHTQPQPVRLGQFHKNQFLSAPVQFTTVTNPGLYDINRELAAGKVFRLDKQFVWNQRVVYTGIEFNRISRVDPPKESFTADFYLWFRYAGDDDVLDVDFPCISGKCFDPKRPLAAETVNGLNYRLYRIQGEFKTTFDFRDYPFDRQALALRLEQPRLTREQVIYVIDDAGLRLSRPPGDAVAVLGNLSSWSFTDVRYFPDTVRTSSTRGHPAAFDADTETELSGFNAVVIAQRRTVVFLTKTLLPLLLLVLIVYVTLHMPVAMTVAH